MKDIQAKIHAEINHFTEKMRFSQVYRLTVKQIRHETHELVLFYKLRYGIGSN